MSNHHDKPGPPCSHMKTMLHDAADGRARGFRRWFAFAHAAKCGRCGRYLAAIQAIIDSLRGHREGMAPDVDERLSKRLEEAAQTVER